MTVEAPLVSVVTPFHDTAAHLRECIESVLAQSHDCFEFLLQDNASCDGSTEIAMEYARRDERIKYFRIEQLLSQVDNYNLALTRISPSSRYTKIVQADDWIAPECVRSMVTLAEGSDRLGLVSSYRLKGGTVLGSGLPYSTTTLSGRDAARMHLLTPTFLYGSPSTVMYRSVAVRARQPFFPVGRLNDDTETCYELLRDWDFGFVHQILSFTRVGDDSISGHVHHLDPELLDTLIMLRRYGPEYLSPEEYKERLEHIERQYYRRLAWSALSLRGRSFWRFQTQGLATQGPALQAAKLARGLVAELAELLTCPRRFAGLARAWRRQL